MDPNNSSIVYAAADDILYRSTDGANTWSQINNVGAGVNHFTIASGIPPTIYAGGATSGAESTVVSSSDQGQTWQQADSSLSGILNVLAADPFNPAIAYAGTSAGAFRTSNRGGNWLPINSGLGPLPVTCFAIDPTNPATIYAGTGTDGVFKSLDSGASWTRLHSVPTFILCLTIDRADPNLIYAGSTSGLFESPDAGATWRANNSQLNFTVSALAVDPGNSQHLYIATDRGVFVSPNRGLFWFQTNQGLTSTDVVSLTVQPANPPIVYAGTSGGGVFQLQITIPQFAITFPSPTVSVRAGTTILLAVGIPRAASLVGPVTVTPPASPGNGIKLKPGNPISTTDSIVEFKMKIRGNAPPGMYPLVFVGQDSNGNIQSGTVILQVL
jgi:photosystem II stability/assembly factor-like uncharacterized protein